MDRLSADIVSCIAIHLSFRDCVALQLVSRCFAAGLRRAVVWQRWGALSYEDLVQRVLSLRPWRRMHLWSYTMRSLPDVESRFPSSMMRASKELYDSARDPTARCFNAGPVDALVDFMAWSGTIEGPAGTCYEGGLFELSIHIPDQYPFRPPRVRFVTRIYHPNISREGHISVDVLQDGWSPALTVVLVLRSIQIMMGEPNADDPMEPSVAQVYKTDRVLFGKTVREWVALYAARGRKT